MDGDPDSFWSTPAGSHHAFLEISFPVPVTFNEVLIMERLNAGQHVEHFRIQAWNGKEWETVDQGRAIGHKRIDHFAPVSASRVRLNIVSSSGAAEIREFQLFRLDNR